MQVPSEQPALLDWLMEFLERFVLMLMSVLERQTREEDINACPEFLSNCFWLTALV